MRVIVLGAGASKAAGYPTADALMEAVEKHAMSQSHAVPGPRVAWERWIDLRKSDLKEVEFLLANPNPEVVLSALDLYGAAYKAIEGKEWPVRRRRPSWRPVPSKPTKRTRALVASGQRVLSARFRVRPYVEARDCIIACLHDFFQHRHALDATAEAHRRYQYLLELLGQLRPHDIVVTFNWDALAERVLTELDLWTPLDGYGIDRRRLRYRDGRLNGPKRSAVKVLKLHGSLGWYASPDRNDGRGILIDGWVYLKNLGFACDNEPIHVLNADPDSDYHYLLQRYWDWPLMVYPTFLKTVGGGEFADIWSQAGDALARADQVDIYGYSLPASDGAARVLFNQMRRRVGGRGPTVHVHDPSYGARKNWRAFLGTRAKITGDRLG